MGELYAELNALLSQKRAAALATVVSGPAHIGAKLLVLPDRSTRGSLGAADLDTQVREAALQALWHADAHIHNYTITDQSGSQSFEIFIEGFPPPPELIIVGAGHIAQALTTIAKTLNYYVVVIDARSTFATRARFPFADELIVAWPDEVLEQRNFYPSTSVVVLTHDPKFDEPTLKLVLTRNVGYVGAIGNRQTSAERATRLLHEGLTSAQVQRIHGPVGLNIGASSPEEIAVAIMAQIIAVRHRLNSAEAETHP